MAPHPSSPATPAKPRKHLMVPGQPPQPAWQTRSSAGLSRVQKWVMSTLAVSTGLHLAGALVLAAAYVEETSSAIGLLVISGAFGLIAMASGLLIHRRRLTHPLLLVGLLPPLAGALVVFW